MIGFTRSLARKVGRVGVTVNAIAPGLIDTAMTEGLAEDQRRRIVERCTLRRLAETASITAFLIGEAGRNITGTVMMADAGSTA
jgi:3-oxoacyl-[acyl-carrier protein] reductase